MPRTGLYREEPRRKHFSLSRNIPRYGGVFILAILTILFLYFNTVRLKSLQMNSITPKAIVVVNRHGARNALLHHTFENLTWSGPLGQLSVVGLEQAYEFGTQLNLEYYSKYSRASLDARNFEIFANYIQRTEDTAKGIVLGIKHGSTHSPDLSKSSCRCRKPGISSTYSCIKDCLGLESVTLKEDELPHVEVLNEDSEKLGLLLQHHKCKGWLDRVHSFYKNTNAEMKAKKMFKTQYSLLYRLMKNDEICIDKKDSSLALGQSVSVECRPLDLSGVEEVWGNIKCAIAAGKSNFTRTFDPVNLADKLESVVAWKWHNEFSVENGPYCAGMLLDDILNKVVAIITNSVYEDYSYKSSMKDGFRTLIYSGHDSTVASILSVLGLRDWPMPPFLSHVTFVIMGPSRSTNIDTHWIEIKHDDNIPQLEYCRSSLCSLSAFIDKMDNARVPTAACEHV
eukprot:g2319.t1